jgi:hypothetical protein
MAAAISEHRVTSYPKDSRLPHEIKQAGRPSEEAALSAGGRAVFPIPPLQQLGVMAVMGSIVDSSTEDIKQTRIDSRADLRTTFLIELLGIFAFEIIDASNTQFPKILGNALSDARYLLQLLERQLLRSVVHSVLLSQRVTLPTSMSVDEVHGH